FPRTSSTTHTSTLSLHDALPILCVARTLRFDETQSAARQRYDDVIEGMNVLARLCTRCEGPLGDDDAVIFDLYGWDGFHVCDALFDQVFSESSGIDRQVAATS